MFVGKNDKTSKFRDSNLYVDVFTQYVRNITRIGKMLFYPFIVTWTRALVHQPTPSDPNHEFNSALV